MSTIKSLEQMHAGKKQPAWLVKMLERNRLLQAKRRLKAAFRRNPKGSIPKHREGRDD